MPMNLPNKLTIIRIILIPFFVFFLLTGFVPGSKWIALAIFIVASLTDLADGKIARKYHTTVARLCKLDHIKSTTLLRVGRRLRVS